MTIATVSGRPKSQIGRLLLKKGGKGLWTPAGLLADEQMGKRDGTDAVQVR